MYTQCPECDTIFRVNAAVLRTAQGQVRCGVCDATFDAIRFLMDEIESGVNAASASGIQWDPDPTEPTPRAPQTPPEPASESPTPPFLPETQLPLVAFEVAEAANEWWATPVTTELPAFLLGTPPSTDTPADTAEPPIAAAEPVTHDDDRHVVPLERASEPESATETDSPWPIAAAEYRGGAPIAPEALDRLARAETAPQRRPRQRLRWSTVGLMVSATALFAQVVDHERDRLVTVPALTAGLTAHSVGRSSRSGIWARTIYASGAPCPIRPVKPSDCGQKSSIGATAHSLGLCCA
jgi:predicted Zn finger-like uncharacterized protein